MFYSYYKIQDFILYIESNDSAITKVKVVDADNGDKSNDVILKFKKELDLYFAGKLKKFSVEYEISYLPWRQKLYQHVCEIEYGNQIQIKDLLAPMNLSKGIRAIASALNDNPLIILIPCHRVNSVVRKFKAHSYSKQFRDLLIAIEK